MASLVNIAEALRRSKKGQLKYEPHGVAYLKKAIDERIWKFLGHSPKLREDEKIKIKAIEEKRDMELRSQREQYLAQLQSRKEEIAQLKRNEQERLAQGMKLMKEEIKESERRQKENDEKTQKRMRLEKQQEDLATAVHQCGKKMQKRYLKMMERLKRCSDVALVADSTKEDVVKYNDVVTAFNHIVDAANTSSLRSDDVTKAVSLVQESKERIRNIMAAIKKTNKAKEQLINEQKNAVRESAMSLYHAEDDQNMIFDQTSIDLPPQASPPQNTNKVVNVEQTSSLQLPRSVENSELTKYYSGCPDYSLFVSPKALEEDIYLQNFLKKIQNSYQPLEMDNTAEMKKYRFQLELKVYLIVNSISSLSGNHLKDKLEKLRKLLSGHLVAILNSPVSSSNLPMSVSFCKDLLAKQIVKQGENQVPCKYAIAATVIGLWIDFPDFGDLLLAHFHKKCPFIIPFYIPQIEGQTEEEHYKALGYKYNNGKIEEQDKYFQRMSGIMRLYSAILCTRVPHWINRPHPHGIEHGWKWMARILNLEPRIDITAIMLYDFLETAGFAMEAAYKNQFEKLISALCEDYFPKLRKISAGGTGEPITRLENFLKNYRTSRRILKHLKCRRRTFGFQVKELCQKNSDINS